MKTGFAHFDDAHRENFCAAVLLLAMEVDPAVKAAVATIARTALSIDAAAELAGFGREARLETADGEPYARVDIWLLFRSQAEMFYIFIEVKTHSRWDAEHVRAQVRDQAGRRALVSSTDPIRGSLLLAPDALGRGVHRLDATLPLVTWTSLLRQLRALASKSTLTDLAIHHLEDTMEHTAGIPERAMSLNDFEQATTTTSCLRQFLVECIADMGGTVRGEPLYLTPGDGRPRRGSGWAWHGLAVPFSLAQQHGRLGIYKYSDAPPGQESAKESLWLEAYLGDGDNPVAFVSFRPPTLASSELERVRNEFIAKEWTAARSRLPSPGGAST